MRYSDEKKQEFIKPYLKINLDSIEKAMKELRPNTFKLWVYLCSNKDKYQLILSSKFATEFCNFSRNTYNDAINEMIAKDYLTPFPLGVSKNDYLFWEGGATQFQESGLGKPELPIKI